MKIRVTQDQSNVYIAICVLVVINTKSICHIVEAKLRGVQNANRM